MIVENGYITPKIKTGGGRGADGKPVKPSVGWGEPVLANITVNKNSLVGKSNGNTFTVASYEVLIEASKYESESVMLSYLDGENLGEFSVMEIVPMQAVGMVKILV